MYMGRQLMMPRPFSRSHRGRSTKDILEHAERAELRKEKAHSIRFKRVKLLYLQLEFFCLQLSFFAYSPLRPLLDALSHCKQQSSSCK